MNTYCYYSDGDCIGTFFSKVPYVSAKKICRLLLRNGESNAVKKFTIINKDTKQLYNYSGHRIKHDSVIVFKNGTTIEIKYKYRIKRIY